MELNNRWEMGIIQKLSKGKLIKYKLNRSNNKTAIIVELRSGTKIKISLKFRKIQHHTTSKCNQLISKDIRSMNIMLSFYYIILSLLFPYWSLFLSISFLINSFYTAAPCHTMHPGYRDVLRWQAWYRDVQITNIFNIF